MQRGVACSGPITFRGGLLLGFEVSQQQGMEHEDGECFGPLGFALKKAHHHASEHGQPREPLTAPMSRPATPSTRAPTAAGGCAAHPALIARTRQKIEDEIDACGSALTSMWIA